MLSPRYQHGWLPHYTEPLLDEALPATESENTPVTFQLPPGFTLTQHHLTLHLYCLHVLQGTEDSALFPVYPQ